jgi:hypothetical protein
MFLLVSITSPFIAGENEWFLGLESMAYSTHMHIISLVRHCGRAREQSTPGMMRMLSR